MSQNGREKNPIRFSLHLLLCLALLAGCAGPGEAPEETPESVPPAVTEATPSPAPAETSPAEPEETEPVQPSETPAPLPEGSLVLSDREEMKEELTAAIEELRQPRTMDVSSLELETPELDGKNIYYEITAARPELKYAYDLSAEVYGNELTCRISYMPYKTGEFPEDFAGEEVASLGELLAAAESHLGEEEAPVRITDRDLEPDRMNRALQQVGGGYILCMLNADATALRYTPPQDMTMEECLKDLELADALADEVVKQVLTPDMTQREQAQALYAYLTVNVAYDQRYYSDKAAMPYRSQTALGALGDHTAICGGYANALKLLYGKIGVPCYTVSGKYFRENHMWNVALLDGEWLWFDATSDRGSDGQYGFLRFALSELDSVKYQYREEDVLTLTGQ